MHMYLGITTLTSNSSLLKHLGRDPTTSARPPVFINGTLSEATNNTFFIYLSSCDIIRFRGNTPVPKLLQKRYSSSMLNRNCKNPFENASGDGIFALLNHVLTVCAACARTWAEL